MVQLDDIHPLTAFLRNHKAHLERLRETGRPEVLTVNGKAKIVIQDAAAYQKMLDLLETVDAVQVLRARLASLDKGDEGISAQQVLADVRKRLGLSSEG
jgi:predicted CoA-binding protein